jgi:hypothetical protein
MLGTRVAEIATLQLSEKDAAVTAEAEGIDLALLRPARRTIGGDESLLAGAPERTEDRGAATDEAARRREAPRLVEDVRRIGLEMIPPWEEIPRPIDRCAAHDHHRRPELGLISEHRRRPLRRYPDAKDNDRENDQYLADQQLGRGHRSLPPGRPARASRSKSPLRAELHMDPKRSNPVKAGQTRPPPSPQLPDDLRPVPHLAQLFFLCSHDRHDEYRP